MKDIIPEGYCQCGCGEKTALHTRNRAAKGYVKGKPMRFLPRHQKSTAGQRQLKVEYIEQDMGYSSPCWIWQGGKGDRGYGRRLNFSTGKIDNAHRVFYHELIGPPPAGKDLDHLCRQPSCVNPWHLDPVSHVENLRRGAGSQINMQIARKIRELWQTGLYTYAEIAARVGGNKTIVGNVVRGKSWRE